MVCRRPGKQAGAGRGWKRRKEQKGEIKHRLPVTEAQRAAKRPQRDAVLDEPQSRKEQCTLAALVVHKDGPSDERAWMPKQQEARREDVT